MSESIWKRPAWVTAIATLVTALLTIPNSVGSYFEKLQATKQIEINNGKIQRELELNTVKEILEKQGTERIFMLRYLGFTTSDANTKEWAKNEVDRLNKLTMLDIQLNEERKALEKLVINYRNSGEAETTEIENEIKRRQLLIEKKNLNLQSMRYDAGLTDSKMLLLDYELLFSGFSSDDLLRIEEYLVIFSCYQSHTPVQKDSDNTFFYYPSCISEAKLTRNLIRMLNQIGLASVVNVQGKKFHIIKSKIQDDSPIDSDW